MANTTLVSKLNETSSARTTDATKGKTSAEIAIQPRAHSSPAFKVSISGLSLVRESLCQKGLREQTLQIIMASWRDSTQKQYAGYLQKWQRFCSGRKVDIFSPPVEEVLHFLTELFEANCGYSALNTARSALSTFIVLPGNISVGNHPLVTRFMKGVFQSRPTFPKYAEIWDVNVVLSYLKTLSPVAKLSLKDLTYKVTMMLMLLSGQRIQTIQLLDLKDMTMSKSQFTFKVSSKVKHTKPGRHLQDLKFKAYAPDRRLCIYTYLQKYLAVTKPLRGDETKLLISFHKPYQAVSRDTIRRWIKQVLSNSGIDTNVFSAYSTRSASVSAANSKGVPLDKILLAGGWSHASTFSKYYNKPIVSTHGCDYGSSLLNLD